MTTLILTGILLASVLMLGLSSALSRSFKSADDSSYRDSNGDHVYYERSLIEKKLFKKLHPTKTIRTFSHLFRFSSSIFSLQS